MRMKLNKLEIMKAIKIDENGSVLIDTKKGFNVWVDVWKDEDGDLIADWNKYIFHLDRDEDIEIKSFQENCDNFIEATDLAIDVYEKQMDKLNSEN
jgi:hypothetical protein